MLRKSLTAAACAALCLGAIAPGVAAARTYRFSSFDAPRGASATVNLRVPMGREYRTRASYGLTVGYAAEGDPLLAQPSGGARIADLRFSGDQLRNARLGGLDLANLDRDRRVNNLTGAGLGSTFTIIGIIAVGATICFVITDCFGGDDDAN